MIDIVSVRKDADFLIVKARPSAISTEGARAGLQETYLMYDLPFKRDDYRLLTLETAPGVRVVCSTRVLMEGTQ